jgi:hypothetical protein
MIFEATDLYFIYFTAANTNYKRRYVFAAPVPAAAVLFCKQSNYYFCRAWISVGLCPSFTQNLYTLS